MLAERQYAWPLVAERTETVYRRVVGDRSQGSRGEAVVAG